MTWLQFARHAVAVRLGELLTVPVLEYEPRGDHVGGTWVTVRIAGCDVETVDIEVVATDVLRGDRATQDILDGLVDDIDMAVPPGVFLRSWSFDFDDPDGAIRAVGSFYAARYDGWCEPSEPPALTLFAKDPP